jgi:hypothetical protein
MYRLVYRHAERGAAAHLALVAQEDKAEHES